MNILRAMAVSLLLSMTAGSVCAQGSLLDRFNIATDRWEQILKEGGITVYSQKVPVSDVLAFRATGVLNAPVEQVMEVLRRVDITGEWMPDISVKYAVKEWSDFKALTYSINEMPWPFADRELLLMNRLRLDRIRKFLVVEIFSVEDEKIPVAKGNVRAHMYCGETMLRPGKEGKTEVELILFVDPKGFIPAWLVNYFQKSLPYNFLKALEEKAAATHYTLRPSYQKLLNELKSILP
jgi:hypothetical protein